MIRFTQRNAQDRVSLQDGVRELHPDPLQAALRRLADYEDTGLTPEEITAMKGRRQPRNMLPTGMYECPYCGTPHWPTAKGKCPQCGE